LNTIGYVPGATAVPHGSNALVTVDVLAGYEAFAVNNFTLIVVAPDAAGGPVVVSVCVFGLVGSLLEITSEYGLGELGIACASAETERLVYGLPAESGAVSVDEAKHPGGS
jgi:hypothetical protein